jgi:hypothetical protein
LDIEKEAPMQLNRKKVVLVLLALAVVSQMIPINRSNPPVTHEFGASQELSAVLRRACYDCHSNETVWPWYSRVAPLSWLVAHDVHEGREHLNFSTWGEYPEEKQAKLRKEVWEEVSEGKMPPFRYLPAHPEARLSEQDMGILRAWTGA